MKTVLVIDDEEDARREVAKQLRLAGYNVLQASHTDEAKDMLVDPRASIRHGLCHLIICDNRIREHFGNEGLDFAKQLELFGSTIPFILFTSSSLEELGEQTVLKYHIYYVSKNSPQRTLYDLAIRLLTVRDP